MLQQLNFFTPYANIPGYHENQLTRALLVVLRYSPLAHSTWLSLIGLGKRLDELPTAQFRTQQARLVSPNASSIDDEKSLDGVSVFLTPEGDHKFEPIRQSDRTQILDGIIEYGDELVVAIENKITTGSPTDQASEINTHGVKVNLSPEIRKLTWQKLLEAFADISTRQLAAGCEQKILDDFLEFVEYHFPRLGPYSTLRRAAKSVVRMDWRLDTVLAQAIGINDRPAQGVGWRDLPARADNAQRRVEMAFLGYESPSDTVVLRMYPGDTLSQARALYPHADKVRGLLTLQGWTVRPNFHWGVRASGRCWARGRLSSSAYIDHWIANIASTRQVESTGWGAYWSALQAAGIVTAQEKIEFDAKFTNTQIPRATPRPGLLCEYRWPIKEAIDLDDQGRFVDDVREKIINLLRQLGEWAGEG